MSALDRRVEARRQAPPWWILLLALSAPACVFELADVVVPASDGGPPDAGGSSIDASVDPGNRTANPSFEVDLSGWSFSNSTGSRVQVADAPHGCCVARVTRDSSDLYSMRDKPATIASSVAGATYRASAFVRSPISPLNAAATMRIILDENGTQIGASDYTPIGAGFIEIKTSGQAMTGGLPVSVHLSQYNALAGDAFEVDLVQVTEELPDAGSDGG